MIKRDSLFNHGMKVWIFSEREQKRSARGWHRGGRDINYYPTRYRREHLKQTQKYYSTLTFSYKFEYPNDKVYFAYSFPYTYTDLINHIQRLEKDPLRSQFLTVTGFARSLAGNVWP
jgi:hypothetical protein